MKLIFAILLVLPLGKCEQWILIVPAPPTTESPLSELDNQIIQRPPADVKIIFKEGFVLAKGNDLPIIHFNSYHGKCEFFLKNNSSNDNHGVSMEIKEHLLKENKNISFVVEAWLTPGPEKELDTVSCMRNSNKTLRHMIVSCFEDVLLRPGTDEELKEVQKFKEEFNRTKSPFKIIYENMNVTAQWNANVERAKFSIDMFEQCPDWVCEPGDYIRVFASDGLGEPKLIKLKNGQRNRKFVIEGLPLNYPELDCHDTRPLRDLTVTECKGQIKASRLKTVYG